MLRRRAVAPGSDMTCSGCSRELPPGVDLTAYRVEAPASRATLSLRLVDEAGRELHGSRREVVVVSSAPGWQLALPVIVPLALGLSVWLWRREQVKSACSLSMEQRRRMA